MKKEIFFFNTKTLDPIFLKKAVLATLPVQYLIRYSKLKKKTLILIDTFSFFFTFKLLKKKNNSNFKKNFILSKKNLITSYKNNLKKKLIGSYILLNAIVYTSKNNFKFSFIFFKQHLNFKKIKYASEFLNHLKLINTFKNNITYLKKKKLKRGLVKYYFNGILIFKGKQTNKSKQKVKKILNIFFFKWSFLTIFNKKFVRNYTQNYLFATKKFVFLTHLYNLNTIYSRKLPKFKIFALRKKLYKKDFRYVTHLNLKIKRRYIKINKKKHLIKK